MNTRSADKGWFGILAGTKRSRPESIASGPPPLPTGQGSGSTGVVAPGTATAAPLGSSGQPRSYAAAAGGSSKRSGPSAPVNPRPQLRRGDPVHIDPNYASMDRPVPFSAAPNLLYLDMRSSTMSADDILHAAFPLLGSSVLGFQFFAAQKALGFVFGSEALRNQFANKKLGDSDFVLYPAPPKKISLLKLTLQGVPFWDPKGVHQDLQTRLADWGEVVFLAPMVTPAGMVSDQWHATVLLRAEDSPLPPAILSILGQPVIVDIPGQRRYCRHCEATVHIKPSCRQGQRQKQRQAALLRDKLAVDAANAQPLPSSDTAPDVIPDPNEPSASHDTRPPPPPPPPSGPRPDAFDDDAMDEVQSVSTSHSRYRAAVEILAQYAEHRYTGSEEELQAAQNLVLAVQGDGSGQ
jgi:hypothetical protein